MKRAVSVILALITVLSTCFAAFSAFGAYAPVPKPSFKLYKDGYDVAAERVIAALNEGKDNADISDLNIPAGKYDENHDIKTFITSVYSLVPQYFYLKDPKITYSSRSVNGGPSMLTDITVKSTRIYTAEQQAQTEAEVEKFKSLADKANLQNETDKVIFIHNYLKEKAQYITDAETDRLGNYPFDALCTESCSVLGYTSAFVWLAHEMGLEAYVVIEKNAKNSTCTYFNLVFVDGKGYYLDIYPDQFVNSYMLLSQDAMAKAWTNIDSWQVNELTPVKGMFNDKKYDTAWWRQSVNGVAYHNGLWYTTDGVDLYRGSTANLRSEKLTSHNPGDFLLDGGKMHSSDLVIIGNYLYYSSNTAIHKYDIENGTEELFYELTAEEKSDAKFIADLEAENGEIIYKLANCAYVFTQNGHVLYVGRKRVMCEGEHEFGEWGKYTDGNCTFSGKDIRYCTKCGFGETRENGTYGGHVYGSWQVKTSAPDCQTKGRDIRYCKYCEAYEEKDSDFGPHSFTVWTVSKEETCGEEGEKLSHCDTPNCTATKTTPIPPTGKHENKDGDKFCDICKTDVTLTCTCKCHKGGIAAFFLRIRIFFDKLFGIKKLKYCQCGFAHY